MKYWFLKRNNMVKKKSFKYVIGYNDNDDIMYEAFLNVF